MRTNTEFNPGDLVVIRDWNDMEEEYGLNECGNISCKFTFVAEMVYLCGSEWTIRDIDRSGHVRFSEEYSPDHEYHISTDMIRHVEDESGTPLVAVDDLLNLFV